MITWINCPIFSIYVQCCGWHLFQLSDIRSWSWFIIVYSKFLLPPIVISACTLFLFQFIVSGSMGLILAIRRAYNNPLVSLLSSVAHLIKMRLSWSPSVLFSRLKWYPTLVFFMLFSGVGFCSVILYSSSVFRHLGVDIMCSYIQSQEGQLPQKWHTSLGCGGLFALISICWMHRVFLSFTFQTFGVTNTVVSLLCRLVIQY